MKNKVLIGIGAIIIIAGLSACYDNNNNAEPHITRTTDSVNDNTIDSTGLIEPPTFIIRPDNTYVDLTTGRKIKIVADSVSRDIIDEGTGEAVMFFIDPSTNDTFDRKGRRVNNALIKGNDNSWNVDESKIR
ncbi:MAG: hypothetical protein WKF91_22965 [Segetibacter sp.]|jgi:hypothetical protein